MPNKEIIALEKELKSLRKKPPGSELVTVLNKLAAASLHSDSGRSETCAKEAYELAEKQQNSSEQARSCNTLGTLNLEAGNFTEAMSNCRKAMEIYEELKNMNGKASVLSIMARIYLSQGIFDKGLEHYHMSLRILQESGASKEEIATRHMNIGICYSSLHRLDLALSSYEYALTIMEESGNKKKLAYLYNNIGTIYGEKEELNKAKEYFHKALDIRQDLEDKPGIASTLGNLGILHEIHGENESALKCFIRGLELYEEIGNIRGIAHTCGWIGGINTTLGHLDEAESYIIRGLSITRKLKLKDWEIFCLKKITNLYEVKGDLQKALQHSRELKTCMEEHLNEKSMDKIAGLQVQFETEKKEKEAEIYRLKNVELSEMNDQLRDAFAQVKTLQGMLPICASCKKVRDDDGYWKQIESYISEHSDAEFTHGICPECMIKLYGKDFSQEL